MPLNHGVGDHGLLRGPWTARSNQSILKEVNPEYSLQGLMPKLKLEYFGHLMWRVSSSEKTLMLGKTEGKRRSGWQRMRWHHQLNGHEFDQVPKDSRAWRAAVHGVAKRRRWPSGWTTASLQLTPLQGSGFPRVFRTVCPSAQSLLEYSLHPKRNLALWVTTPSFLARPWPGQPLTDFAPMDLPILHALYKPSHTVFCDWLLSRNVFKVHSFCGQCQYFTSFICQECSIYF